MLGNLSSILAYVEQDPLYYERLPVQPHKDTYFYGDMFIVLVDRCNRTNKTVHFIISREFYNLDVGTRYPGPTSSDIQPPGCIHYQIPLANPFPENMEDGRYIMQGGTRVQGAWKDVSLTWTSRPFTYQKVPGGT